MIDGTAYPVSDSYFNTLTLTDIPLPVKPKGVTVSGTVTSYGSDSDDVTVQLIEAGHTEPAYEAIVSGNSAAYSFDTVPAGTYTLKVMKKGHAPWTEEITVGDGNVTKDVTIYLWGDVDLSGSVDIMDALTLLWYIDPSTGTSLSDHALSVADVDGTPGIDIMDALNVLWYVDPSMGMSKFPTE
ncbi:carboxypeptidase regulatory-like domain-containing protein [Agathobaculum hominis]